MPPKRDRERLAREREARADPCRLAMTTHEHSGPGWRIEVPDGVIGGPAERMTNPELLSSSIFRGWIGDEPFSVIVYYAQAHRHDAAPRLREDLGGLSRSAQ